MAYPQPRDPEKRSHELEHASYGEFEVAIIHDEHGELGTLDQTFDSDVQAGWAAHEAKLDDVGITTEIRELTDDS